VALALGLALSLTLGTTGALAASTGSGDAAVNPYGLQAMWQQGDLVSRGTLILLVLMSLASWTAIVARLLDQRRVLRETRHAAPAFWQAASAAEGAKRLPVDSVLGFVAGQCLAADDQHDDSMAASVDRHTWIGLRMERAVAQVQSRMQRGLALLATVASTAPFVGLFGTVWGIYHALVAIGVSGQASIDKVAGPVGEALIMTAIGLAVAVPAVMGHNALVRRNKLVMDEVRAFGADLHEVLVAGRSAPR
jgi:biopolymer transport protein ExbB